ncbi:MAG: tetratricopeptide repeat protein [Pseudomonadota bacterium]
MSDDSFIREVDEELRSDRMRQIWTQYGRIIIGVAVAIVLVTVGYQFYLSYRAGEAAEAGDAFLNAVELAEAGKTEEAEKALSEIIANSTPAYQGLAQLRLAAEKAVAGDHQAAIAAYDAVAANSVLEKSYRDMANLRAAIILVDHGSLEDVIKRAEPLASPSGIFRFSAQEALGLASYKAKKLEDAAKWFTAIANDASAPTTMRGRADLMLSVIASVGGPKKES